MTDMHSRNRLCIFYMLKRKNKESKLEFVFLYLKYK